MFIASDLRTPFPGLRPFDEADSEFFFGQEEQQESLLGRLSTSRFVSVIGASGCGKSSLVRAGLIPLLRQQRDGAVPRWAIAVTHPGTRPLRQLADSLYSLRLSPEQSIEDVESMVGRHTLGILEFLKVSRFEAGRRLLIFVDQFEELFRYRRNRANEKALDESALYVKILLESARQPHSPVYIVTTMRSEYLEDCSEFYDLSDAMNQGLFLLPRMTRLQCEEAIAAPIEAQDARIEAALIQRLLNETEERMDGLPLLQHALRVTWDKWRADGDQSRALGLAHFEIAEGNPNAPMVNRLLDVHLDKIYLERKSDQVLVQRCFKLLSEWDARGRETRRPCAVQEMLEVTGADLISIERVVNSFRDEEKGRTFLRVMDEGRQGMRDSRPIAPGDVLDLSHECLMRQWGRLREWMKEEYQNSSTLGELARDAETGEPLSDFKTKRFARWRDEFRPSRGWAERYANSVHPVTGRQRIQLDLALVFLEENERRQRTMNTQRLWKRIGIVLSIFLSVIVALAVVAGALQSKKVSDLQREKADAVTVEQKKAAAAAQAATLAETTLRKEAQDEARNAGQSERKADARALEAKDAAKREATARADAEKNARKAGEAAMRADAEKEKADEQTEIAKKNAGLAESNARKADVATKETQRVLMQARARTLVESAWRRADSHKPEEALAYLARALELDPDSRLARTWIFNLLLRQKVPKLTPPFLHDAIQPKPAERLFHASFNRDGDRIVTASWNGTAQIWNSNGTTIGVPLQHEAPVNYAEFSPDGKYVATASSSDNRVCLWDMSGGKNCNFEHKGRVLSVSFSSDGGRLVTASWDTTVKIWDLRGGEPLRVIRLDSPANFAAFSPDGLRVVTAEAQGIARIWKANSGEPASSNSLHHSGQVRSARFNKDGKRVVTASVDHTAVVWDWAAGLPIGEALRHQAAVNSAAFSPDGESVVTASDDNTARVWDADTGMPLGEPLPHKGHVMSAVFSPDGTRVLTASYDMTAQVWDVGFDFGKDPKLLADLSGAVSGFAFHLLPADNLPPMQNQEGQFRSLRDRAASGSSPAAWFVRWFLASR